MRRYLYVNPWRWDPVRVDGQPTAAADGGSEERLVGDSEPASRFAAFLFADIRGFTAFTSEHGAEASAELAARFSALAREVIASHRGSLSGVWGDEVLAEFTSCRDAERAALALQQRCRNETLAQPDAPLAVGVGLDVGEAASAEELRAGGALNLAARLCAAAGPGEVLASSELVHLAGTVVGVRADRRGRLRIKGVEGRVPVLRLRPTACDLNVERRFRAVVANTPQRRRRRRRQSLIAALIVAALVAGCGAYWLARPTHPSTTTIPGQAVAAINPGSGRLLGSVPLGQSPAAVAATPDGSQVWVANPSNASVVVIDTKSRAVTDTIYVEAGPSALVAVGDNVWVVNSLAGMVSEISTQTGQPIATIPVGSNPSAIAYGLGWLWVTNQGDGTLTRLDPAGALKARTVDVGTAPDGVAVGDGGVWVANRDDNTVVRVDATSLQADAPIHVGAGPGAILATPSGVWVADSLETNVTRIDPRAEQSTNLIGVGQQPSALAASQDAIWVADAGDATLARIDVTTNRVTKRLEVGSSPHGLATAGSTLWVAAQPYASTTHRGGTLTIAYTGPRIVTIDPAVNYFDWSPLRMVYDGLLAWNRAPGANGYELVPDLAVTMPTVSADGRTYTFTMRAEIRYSDGRLVRASDIRRAVERQFLPVLAPRALLGHPAYYDDIVGAAECRKHPPPCYLDAGIVVDDSTRTVIFHLTHRDPDFLPKLAALEFTAAVPQGTPDHDVGTHPSPGTGPYMISKYVPDRQVRGVTIPGELTVVRNQYFRQWSVAAQPQGYPDVIRWLPQPADAAAVAAVEQKRADVDYPDTEALQTLRRRYPTQVHVGTAPQTEFLVLNAKVPPFNNPTARRAVAAAFTGDPAFARDGPSACRLTPTNYPGYTPGCPYRRDLAKATQLVKSSATVGERVHVYFWRDPRGVAWGSHVTAVLRHIGYDAQLTLQTPDDYTPPVYDPRTKPMNIEYDNWLPDFFAASQYYQPLLSCTAGTLTFGSCNHAIDTLAARAAATQLTDAGAAERLWQRVYQMVDQDARLIATDAPTGAVVILSPRTGNYRPQIINAGLPDLDQLWVRP
jgi:peptide/nickel transport system substrate-binding protein